ncbi:MAG: hypothetical protein R3C18_21925 [Planctomycetaceae bacterium]
MQTEANTKPSGKITPLWIVAAFVTLTEVALGYALTQVTGGVQIALTVFVISFALLVAGTFFFILWHRPYVFYPPSEYGDTDPKRFIDALRPSIPEALAKKIEHAKSDPDDVATQFALIDSLIDDIAKQLLILMVEKDVTLPFAEYYYIRYQFRTKANICSGSISTQNFRRQLEGTGLIDLNVQGPTIELTVKGRQFAQWLLDQDGKADFFHSDVGSWGERSLPEGMPAEMLERSDLSR